MTSREHDKLIEKVDSFTQSLQAALLRSDETQADRVAVQLDQMLLDNETYRSIFDEQALAAALRTLRNYYQGEIDDDLEPIEAHLAVVRAIHQRLYAVLDPDVSIETLLYDRLNNWPQLDTPIECVFERVTEVNLSKTRAMGPRPKTLRFFFEEYFRVMHRKGYSDTVDLIQQGVFAAIDSLKRFNQWTLRGLFVIKGQGELCGISIKPNPGKSAQPLVHFNHDIDPDMRNAAERARSCATDINRTVNDYNYDIEISRRDTDYAGNSIGLALGIGYLAETEDFPISPYVAFTGHLEFRTRNVASVQDINEKIEAAKEAGVREVFLSEQDVSSITVDTDALKITQVSTLDQAWQELKDRVFDKAEPSLEARMRKLELLLKQHGIRLIDRKRREHGIRLTFYNREKIPVDVYFSHKVVVGGSPKSSLRETIEQVVNEVFGHASAGEGSGTRYTLKATNWSGEVPTAELRQRVKDYAMSLSGSRESVAKHCDYTAQIVQGQYKLQVMQYTSGKLVLQGKDDPLFSEVKKKIESILGIVNVENGDEPRNDRSPSRQEEQQAAVRAVELGEEWVGTDESGKGDYFGPLVSAGVYVNLQIARKLDEIGVADSKSLSDKRVNQLAPQVEAICGRRCTHVVVNPEKYNDLYDQFRREGKNLNSLLAWTHTRALENVLPGFRPRSPLTVLIDKFADERYIQDRFKREKLLPQDQQVQLRLVQLPKAEANIAVAAASILARFYFLQQLSKLAARYDVDLPKGASDPRIVPLGKQIVAKHGQQELRKLAKVHFRTTRRILE